MMEPVHLIIKPMIHDSTFVDPFIKCRTVYHAMLNENRDRLCSVQQVATLFNICWTTNVKRCLTMYHFSEDRHFSNTDRTDRLLKWRSEGIVRTLTEFSRVVTVRVCWTARVVVLVKTFFTVFLYSDVDSYEDGDGQALRDTLNRCEINYVIRHIKQFSLWCR